MNLKHIILHATGFGCIIVMTLFAAWTIGLSLFDPFYISGMIAFIASVTGLFYSGYLLINWMRNVRSGKI